MQEKIQTSDTVRKFFRVAAPFQVEYDSIEGGPIKIGWDPPDPWPLQILGGLRHIDYSEEEFLRDWLDVANASCGAIGRPRKAMKMDIQKWFDLLALCRERDEELKNAMKNG